MLRIPPLDLPVFFIRGYGRKPKRSRPSIQISFTYFVISMEFGSNEWISWHSTTPSLKTATTSDRLALMLFAGLSLCKTLNWLSHEAISLCNSILMFFQLMSKMWHSAAEVFVRTLGGPWQEQDFKEESLQLLQATFNRWIWPPSVVRARVPTSSHWSVHALASDTFWLLRWHVCDIHKTVRHTSSFYKSCIISRSFLNVPSVNSRSATAI